MSERRENPVSAALHRLTDSVTALPTLAFVLLLGFVAVYSIGTRSPELLAQLLAWAGLVAVGVALATGLVLVVVRSVARAVAGPLAHVEAEASDGEVVLSRGDLVDVLRWVEPRLPRRISRPYAVVVPAARGLSVSFRSHVVIVPWSRVRAVRRRRIRRGLRRHDAVVVDLSRAGGGRTRSLTLVPVEQPGLLGQSPASEQTLVLLHRRIAAALPPGEPAPAWGSPDG
ncbi:hypothetical protein GSU69_12000 [Rathayibacter festucae]|uniref:DUF304 domain-containing protein n=1 Tax=Rathayibacter festucae TaxID=110937 RepID=A0ABX6H0M0_9MICO|nr:hypothetical protein [Rathayibacter festucae]QHC63330.1 hypothetical protein GSU69_12000 [Rathayibacter festucae]